MTTAHFNIDEIAELARLELTQDEKNRFESQLGNILSYVKQLQSVNVENIQPTSHAFDLKNIYREDIPGPTFTPEEALLNAPYLKNGQRAIHDNQLIVPKVVE